MQTLTLYKKDLTEEFLNKLATFLNEGFPSETQTLWKLRFKLWWFSNPFLTDTTPVCWIIEDETTNTLIGFLGNLMVLFKYGNQHLRVSDGTSWYVAKNIRGPETSSLYFTFSRQKNADVILNTTPSSTIQTILPTLGFKQIGGDKLQNYMIIINVAKYISMMATLLDHFSESQSGNKAQIFVLASKVGNICSKILPKRKQAQMPAHDTDGRYIIRDCKNSQSFLESLTKHKKGNTIELSKDKTTLDWILFSPEVQALLRRTTAQIFTKTGEYCGYFIYDIQHVGKDTTLRIRELQLLKPEDAVIKLILKHAKVEAKNAGCAAVYSGLQNPDPAVDKLLHKHILLSLKTENRYYVKFRKNVITDVDPYSIYVPSDLDPDVGFI